MIVRWWDWLIEQVMALPDTWHGRVALVLLFLLLSAMTADIVLQLLR